MSVSELKAALKALGYRWRAAPRRRSSSPFWKGPCLLTERPADVAGRRAAGQREEGSSEADAGAWARGRRHSSAVDEQGPGGLLQGPGSTRQLLANPRCLPGMEAILRCEDPHTLVNGLHAVRALMAPPGAAGALRGAGAAEGGRRVFRGSGVRPQALQQAGIAGQ
eukprot:jgi/Tetstr1/460210/TSEL_005525.t1